MNQSKIPKAVLVHLRSVFPPKQPKLGMTMEEVLYNQGQQEVLAYIERTYAQS